MLHPDILAHEAELAGIRRHLHERPELAFEERETSAFVADRLAEWGFQVASGIAGTGVVGTLQAGTGRRSVALRADMDGLPIEETTGLSYRSRNFGKMHACGHDGQMAMLLGAANIVRAQTFRVYEPLLLVAGVYVAMTVVIAVAFRLLERRVPSAGRP